MTLNEEQKRLEFLRSEINRHDRLYYVEARPEIGDADYDLLYREMLAIEQAHPEWVTPDSPSQRVSGAPVSGFKQVRHDPPMRSLDKTHSKAELGEFDAFLRKQLPGEVWDYVVEPKVDGVSPSLPRRCIDARRDTRKRRNRRRHHPEHEDHQVHPAARPRRPVRPGGPG